MTRKAKKRLHRPDLSARSHVDGLLTDIRLTGASLAEFLFGADGALAMHGIPFLFVVVEGRCSYVTEAGVAGSLAVGDAIVSLHGARVGISARDDARDFRDIKDVWRENAAFPASYEGYGVPIDIPCGSGRVCCRLLGSVMTMSRPMALSSVVRKARLPFVLTADATGFDPGIGAFRALLQQERERPRLGFASAGTAAVQFLLIQMLRARLDGDGAHAIPPSDHDRGHRITMLLSRLQRDPGSRWTLHGMAKEAGMSRTSFLQRFAEITGMTPARYLASCRMEYAGHLLRGGERAIAQVAELCGYLSERAFRETFVRTYGRTPSAFRREATESKPAPAGLRY